MIELTSVTLIIAGLLLTAIAFLAGWYAGKHSAQPSSSREAELEESLSILEEKHAQYQQDVNQHFSETARLVGQLTQNYRSVYEHLSEGASTLCDQNQLPQTLVQAIESTDKDSVVDNQSRKPPLDYAPKTSPDEPGMLNERYGLNERSASINPS